MPNFLNDIVATGKITVGGNTAGHDVQFFGTSSGKNVLWDESADRLIFADSTYLAIGTGSDILMYHTGTNSLMVNQQGNLTIQNSANDKDIIFIADDGSGGNETYFYLDGSDSTANPQTVFPDNSFLCFGSNTTTQTGDLYIKHNGTNSFINNYTGNLTIKNEANDKDIFLSCDDQSGGTTAYITLDGSTGKVLVARNTEMSGTLDVASTFTLTDANTAFMQNLPGADPGNPGQLWRGEEGHLMVSGEGG